MKFRLSIFLLLLQLPVFADHAPGFDFTRLCRNATHIIVASEADMGKFCVLESWRGDLQRGARIDVPHLHDFAYADYDTETAFPPDKLDMCLPSRMSFQRFSRVILFLRRDAAGKWTNAYFSAEEREIAARHSFGENPGKQYAKLSIAWSEDTLVRAFFQWTNPGPRLLRPFQLSEQAMKRAVLLSQAQPCKIKMGENNTFLCTGCADGPIIDSAEGRVILAHCRKGKTEGLFNYYDSTGNLSYSANMENGQRTKLTTYAQGKITTVYLFKKGKEYYFTSYFPSGKVQHERNRKNGYYVDYYDDEKHSIKESCVRRFSFSKSWKIKSYYDNGQLKIEERYRYHPKKQEREVLRKKYYAKSGALKTDWELIGRRRKQYRETHYYALASRKQIKSVEIFQYDLLSKKYKLLSGRYFDADGNELPSKSLK